MHKVTDSELLEIHRSCSDRLLGVRWKEGWSSPLSAWSDNIWVNLETLVVMACRRGEAKVDYLLSFTLVLQLMLNETQSGASLSWAPIRDIWGLRGQQQNCGLLWLVLHWDSASSVMKGRINDSIRVSVCIWDAVRLRCARIEVGCQCWQAWRMGGTPHHDKDECHSPHHAKVGRCSATEGPSRDTDRLRYWLSSRLWQKPRKKMEDYPSYERLDSRNTRPQAAQILLATRYSTTTECFSFCLYDPPQWI